MKLPAFQFYPGDWLRDPIAGCSLAAQGLWLRMMILAHDSENYGYLVLNGLPMTPDSIARRCACSLDEYKTLLCELDAAGIPSRTPKDIIFSRRMVRDAKARDAAALRQQKARGKLGETSRSCHASVTPLSQPSSSSSSSSSSKEEKTGEVSPDPSFSNGEKKGRRRESSAERVRKLLEARP
jgi:hypothetical protein